MPSLCNLGKVSSNFQNVGENRIHEYSPSYLQM
jgi:hypothetical protein